MSLARTAVIAVSVVGPFTACAGSPYETLASVRSMCDTPFEEGRIVQVSGVFAGDRFHYSYFYDDACRGKVWNADYREPFYSRNEKALELGSALVIGPAYRHFRIEVEGRLYLGQDGKPGIEFMKLGRIVERLEDPDQSAGLH